MVKSRSIYDLDSLHPSENIMYYRVQGADEQSKVENVF